MRVSVLASNHAKFCRDASGEFGGGAGFRTGDCVAVVCLFGGLRGGVHSDRRALGYFLALDDRAGFVLDSGAYHDLSRWRFAGDVLRMAGLEDFVFRNA